MRKTIFCLLFFIIPFSKSQAQKKDSHIITIPCICGSGSRNVPMDSSGVLIAPVMDTLPNVIGYHNFHLYADTINKVWANVNKDSIYSPLLFWYGLKRYSRSPL